jgi:hypothetical protein
MQCFAFIKSDQKPPSGRGRKKNNCRFLFFLFYVLKTEKDEREYFLNIFARVSTMHIYMSFKFIRLQRYGEVVEKKNAVGIINIQEILF